LASVSPSFHDQKDPLVFLCTPEVSGSFLPRYLMPDTSFLKFRDKAETFPYLWNIFFDRPSSRPVQLDSQPDSRVAGSFLEHRKASPPPASPRRSLGLALTEGWSPKTTPSSFFSQAHGSFYLLTSFLRMFLRAAPPVSLASAAKAQQRDDFPSQFSQELLFLFGVQTYGCGGPLSITPLLVRRCDFPLPYRHGSEVAKLFPRTTDRRPLL